MVFNSLEFAIFLPIVFTLYWLAKKQLGIQNIILLFGSYFFYGYWDWRFLFILLFSTSLDFFSGLKIYHSDRKQEKKGWLWLSIFINIGILGVFKYYNFFIQSFAAAFDNVGIHINTWTLNIIIPVGISFYTFHGLSYIIDIYKERISPERNFINYAVFVSFFPLLVAGPIERATHLLPQIRKERNFEYVKAVDGLRQILWGLFKKVVIADNFGEFADEIFNNTNNYSGSALVLGALCFSFQIYGDFSGYSDIAIGTARLFGIELLRNFAYPYFSRDIAEFWRRWHISLSSWFRDYLYIPLGGSRVSKALKIRNTLIIFVVSGFWHGANWTFIIWGALHALYFLPLLLTDKNRENLEIIARGKKLPQLKELFAMLSTFFLTTFAWIFFRAENYKHGFSYIKNMFGGLFNKISYYQTKNFAITEIGLALPIILLLFIVIEWLGREEHYAIQKIGEKWPIVIRYAFYYMIIVAIFWFVNKEKEFIYFQF